MAKTYSNPLPRFASYFIAAATVFLVYLVFYSIRIRIPGDRSARASILEPCAESESPYLLLLTAASRIPFSHYALAFSFSVVVYLYNLLEFHILSDLFGGFRGGPVTLKFHPCSELYESVVSRCRILHGRYLPTPWLSSPHLQTIFVGYFGRPPLLSYRRELFHTPDGGTIALDWLRNSDVVECIPNLNDTTQSKLKDDRTPIVIVIPGITSDSTSSYIKHIAYKMAKRGWNVCVVNHRGFGGLPITSDVFHNGGWTVDIRNATHHIHHEYPEAPLYAVGISIGANILVKYLGEDGINVPVVGAAAICSPWDNLVTDRFLNRSFVQKLYNRVIANNMKRYAEWHQSVFCRLSDWEGIKKSTYLRDFDRYGTSHLGKFKTVDTYYRHSSSVNVVDSVAVPLLSISALDDPVCSVEAIPWDECRENENIILATTSHGGHVAYYEGISGNRIWWVRAVDEFLHVLHSSQFVHRKKRNMAVLSDSLGSSTGTVLQNGTMEIAGDYQANDSVEIPPLNPYCYK